MGGLAYTGIVLSTKLLPFVIRNAIRNRRRSLLTVASIAVSLCLLGVLASLYLALYHAPDRSPAAARRAITRHKVSLAQVLPLSYRQRIEQVPGVQACTYSQWFGGTYIKPENFFAQFGIDPKTMFDVYPDVVLPPEQRDAFQRTRTACIASRALAEKFGWKLGERITLVGTFFPVTLELELAGIFDDPDRQQVLYFDYGYVIDALGRDFSVAGTYTVITDSPERVPEVSRAIDATFANSPAPTRTESEKEFGRQFLGFLGNLKLFLAAISGAVMFTILLVSANTIAMAVRERTRETAILRTLGYAPGEVVGMVLGEAALLGLLGGTIGAALATLLCVAVRVVSREGGFFLPLATPGAMIWSGLMSIAILIGVISAVVPAVVASRRPIIEGARFAG
jgi:putative ABC transport system permease protein